MTAESLKGSYALRLGDSFDPHSRCRFATFRYDFVPASVDPSKPGLVETNAADGVSVSLTHGVSSSVSHTFFRGHKSPCQKECVLILDRRTGEARLERVSTRVQLKRAVIEVCQLDLVEKKLAQQAELQEKKAGHRAGHEPPAKMKRPGASKGSDSLKRPGASNKLDASKRPDISVRPGVSRRSGSSKRPHSTAAKAAAAAASSDKKSDKRPDKRPDKKPDKKRDKRPEKEAKKAKARDKASRLLASRSSLSASSSSASSSPSSSPSRSSNAAHSDLEEAQPSQSLQANQGVNLKQLQEDLQLSESGSDTD